MPRKGWIKLHRALLDNPMWEEKPFSVGQAWVDLLLLCSYDEHEVDGQTCQPGTVRLSKEWLMARWGWTRWKMDKVLRRWEAENMIQRTTQRTNQRTSYTVLTVVKWENFQGATSKNQRTNQRTNQPQQKNIYKNSGDDGGLSPRHAEKAGGVMRREWVEDHWEVIPS